MVIRYGESLWPGTSPRPGEDGSYEDQPRLTRMGGRVGRQPFPFAASSRVMGVEHMHVTSFKVSSDLIRTNFRGHLISRIWNTNISRALIFAILQKMINLGHLISRKLTKDRLRKPFFY